MAVVEPEVVAQLKRSLRTLGTDHVDVYQFHSGSDAVFENNELWEALAAQRQAGKVRFLGVSLGDNQSSRQTERATEIGADMAAWALASVLRDPAVTSVIPGCKFVEQVESNAAAANLVLAEHGTDRGVTSGTPPEAMG